LLLAEQNVAATNYGVQRRPPVIPTMLYGVSQNLYGLHRTRAKRRTEHLASHHKKNIADSP
jgi:hypothetical protein